MASPQHRAAPASRARGLRDAWLGSSVSRRGGWRLLGLVAALIVVVAALAVPSTRSAYTAKITNSADTTGIAAANSCAWTYATNNPTPYFLYPLSDNPVTTTAVDTSGNKRTATYTGTPAHSGSNACTRDKDGTTTFNGTNTLLVSPTAQANPQLFTLEIWFRTSIAGGYLIGLNNSATGAGGSYDRHLYLNSTGQVVFGIYSGGVRTITSTASYNNNAWHHAAATFSSTAGLTLYVDGQSVGTPITTAYTAETNNGYWRIGYGNLSGWPGSATPYYFNGQLGYAAVYTSVLSSTTVTAHYNAGI